MFVQDNLKVSTTKIFSLQKFENTANGDYIFIAGIFVTDVGNF